MSKSKKNSVFVGNAFQFIERSIMSYALSVLSVALTVATAGLGIILVYGCLIIGMFFNLKGFSMAADIEVGEECSKAKKTMTAFGHLFLFLIGLSGFIGILGLIAALSNSRWDFG
ncbi:MAG: hypothetical protein AAGG75_16495 [Bacteroidota bacterium]